MKITYYIILGLILLTTPDISVDAQTMNQSLLQNLTTPSNGRSMRISSTDEDFDGNGDSKEIMPGETLIIADLEGPGIIKHIWNTSASINPFSARALVIRIYWDNSDKPSVEVPLGDFFGVGLGAKKEFQSLPISVSSLGRSRTCFWEMPFKKHAKITVSNELPQFGPAYFYYYVDWEKVDKLPDSTLYFHARYNQQTHAKTGDHVILDTKGKGNYVGTVYSVVQKENGWFGEGDDRFYIDGESTPSLQGTGTEDYFNDSWGFRKFAGNFHGVTFYEGPLAGDRVSAYRWHIPDPIHFSKSLKFTIEHRGSEFDDEGNQHSSSGERADWISSVAFWYQTPITFSEENLPPAEERTPPYKILIASGLKMKAIPDKVKTEVQGVTFKPATPDGRIDFEFEVEKPGKYKVSAVLVDGLFGGVYQPLIDDIAAGPVLDMVSKGGDWTEYVFGRFELEKGTHTLSFEGKGDSPKMRPSLPKKYEIGISTIILLRIEDL